MLKPHLCFCTCPALPLLKLSLLVHRGFSIWAQVLYSHLTMCGASSFCCCCEWAQEHGRLRSLGQVSRQTQGRLGCWEPHGAWPVDPLGFGLTPLLTFAESALCLLLGLSRNCFS